MSFPNISLLGLVVKCRIERDVRRFKVVRFDCSARFASTMFAVHSTILPFNRQRPIVTDAVERSNDLLKVNAPAAD